MSNWSERSWYEKVNAHRVARGVPPLDIGALEAIATNHRRRESLTDLPKASPPVLLPAEGHKVHSATGWLGGRVLPFRNEE